MRGFFYGNWFVGLCAVALSIEAIVQQGLPMNGWSYYLLVFLACVLFYNHAYRDNKALDMVDDRAQWYAIHGLAQRWVQAFLLVLCCVVGTYHVHAIAQVIPSLRISIIGWLFVFPLVGVAYYGSGRYALRNIGWLKPFVLGFVWAGVVTTYPVYNFGLLQGTPLPDPSLTARLFAKNLLFCAMIGALFDIKDHAADHRNALRTFVVQRGLRSTLFTFILPVTLLTLLAFLAFGTTHGFSGMRLILYALPFLALLVVAYTLRRRRSTLYYLVVVDGLLLLKAACGIAAMHWF